MAFPLGAVLAAAPSVISAAADIIRVIKEKKTKNVQPEPESQRLDEMASLIERQAQVIEELAVNNSNLALAVRNNRILSVISLAVGFVAVLLSVSL
ncbi:MAG: hypothetical protein L0Z73_19400 [Gammaproteobacteria bacterium]|nr:hypothetical protein [Gammaproteobacteria bacterium]